MDNQTLLSKVIGAIITVGGRNTSHNYIKIVLDTIITRLADTHEIFKHVRVRSLVSIDSEIDDVDKKEFGTAINELLKEIAGCAGDKRGKETFFYEFNGYIGTEVSRKLKDLGVELIPE